MFSVIFEVHPRPERWDDYLGNAGMLRPELERVDGFVDNIRYRSLTREGWILSLSGWRDEKAVVRWRTMMGHHLSRRRGGARSCSTTTCASARSLRDTRVPEGHALREQRLDETEVGEGTTVALIDARRPADWPETFTATDASAYLGLDREAEGLVGWDVLDAVLTPGDLILLTSWRTAADAEAFERRVSLPEGARLRRVRVVRDYGMFDRREAPQYYPEVRRPERGA